MAGFIRHLNICRLEITFVFRHRWEKFDVETDKIINDMTMWREWQLGLNFRRIQIVGKKNFHKPKEWKNNLVNEYIFGVDLLICKFWFTYVRGGMNLNIEQ